MKKKSNLAFLAPAGLLSLCSDSVYILVSSYNIPTLKSWSVLSIPFIQPGGSWTLRKFSSLFPSGVETQRKVRVCSSCPQGLIHLRHNTTPAKIILSEKNNLFQLKTRIYKVNISRKYPETRTRKKRVQQSETQSSVGLRQKRRLRIEQRIALV